MMCRLNQKRQMMKPKLVNNHIQCIAVRLMLGVGILFASGAGHASVEDVDAQYFVAHQVAKVHNVAEILISDANPKTVEFIITDLINHHKQGALIKSYSTNKEMSASLKEGVKDSLLSPEFSSWLNEKIANAYVDEYSYQELKLMYQEAYKGQDSGFGAYLSEYIKNQDDKQALASMQEELFKKELEQRVAEVLDTLPSPNNKKQ